MSKDTIYREDAIKVTWQEPTYTDPLNVLTEVRDRIEALPSADRPKVDAELKADFLKRQYEAVLEENKRLKADRPQGEWIPCEERLPEERGQYLVTTYAYNDYHYVDVLSFHKGKFYETDDEWGDVEYDDVTAWMPLPKPYGEREGE